jgi:hypothetical protein
VKGFKSLLLYGYVITDSLKDWAAEAKDEADQDTLIEWIKEQEDDNIKLCFSNMREDDDWFWGKILARTHYYEELDCLILKQIADEELHNKLKESASMLFNINEEPKFYTILVNDI